MRARGLIFLTCQAGICLAIGLGAIACSGVAVQPEDKATPVSGAILPTEVTAPLGPAETQPGAPTQPDTAEPVATNLPEATALPPTVSAPTAQPAILEARRLVLEWPPTIRVGDSDYVILTLEMDTQGNLTPTVETEGHEARAETIQIPNLYDTHRVLAEARLDMAGLEVKPNDLVSQSLLPGRAVTFRWSVSPDKASTYRGTVWFTLRYIPIQDGAESQHPVSAQTIEIRGVNFLGLSGLPARILGGVGTLLGSVISLDSLIPWMWKRLKKKFA